MRLSRNPLKNKYIILIKITAAILQGICVLFIGLLISFFFFNTGISNPSLHGYQGLVDPEAYENLWEEFGFNDPIMIRFRKYLFNFFNGNWGKSFIIREDEQVTELMKTYVPGTIGPLFLPMMIGLIGIPLGRICAKKRDTVQGLIIRIFTIMGLSMPIFFIASMMQFEFRNDLPVFFRYEPGLPASPYVTGFPFIDAIIDRNWILAGSIIGHSILPTITLSLVIIPIVIKQTQTNIERNSKDTSFVSNSFMAGKMFGTLFTLVLMIEMTFVIKGFAYYLVYSIFLGDFFVIIGSLFIIIILFSFTIVFSNILPIPYTFLKRKISKTTKKIRNDIRNILEIYRERLYNIFESFKSRDDASQPFSEPINRYEDKIETKPMIQLKDYLINVIKNPFIIVGLGLMIFLVFISAFPQLFTPYSLNEVTLPYIPPGEVAFDPPSPDHPLGTTKYGYDLLARIIYGTRDALVVGIITTFLGLVFGSIFGFLAGRFHRYVHNVIIGSFVMFLIIPGLMLIILLNIYSGGSFETITMTIGFLLSIGFTGIIANAIRRESNYINVIKVIIKYIPLEMAFGIMLYQMLGYLGLGIQTTANLGQTFNWGRASFSLIELTYYPGLYIFIIMISLILLHEGLEAPKSQREFLDVPVISS
ncbi:MAG: ABC transporter permease subunit [Candidatus Hermodarchaeota archaeon]